MFSERIYSPSRIRRNRIDCNDNRNQFFVTSPEETRFHSSAGSSADFHEKKNKIERTNPLSCKRMKGHGNVIFHNVTRKKLPFIGRQIDKFHSLPLPLRLVGLFIFFLYKVVMTYIMIKMFFPSGNLSEIDLLRKALHWNQHDHISTQNSEINENILSLPSTIFENALDVHTETNSLEDGLFTQNKRNKPNTLSDLRILKIVLSTKNFEKNENGLKAKYITDELIPSLLETFTSISSSQDRTEVDIYLILTWKLKDDLRQKIQTSMPSKSSIVIIDGVSSHHKDTGETRDVDSSSLFVINEYQKIIKQYLEKYDFFTVFEVDMRITSKHILHYIQIVNDIDHLLESATETRQNQNTDNELALKPLEKSFISKLVPGYLLVNVASKVHSVTTSNDVDLINKPISHENKPVDPSICCLPRGKHEFQSIPDSSNIILHEMPSAQRILRKVQIDKIDSLRQVVMESTNQNDLQILNTSHIQQNLRKKNKEKPLKHMNYNQIGWMGTQKQISQWISNFGCFEDVLDSTNKNIKLISDQSLIRGVPPGCDVVPFLSLDTDVFSKQLVYFNSELPSGKDKEDSQHAVMSVNKFYHEVEELPQDKKI